MDLLLRFYTIPLIYTSDFVLVPYCFDDCLCSVVWRQKTLFLQLCFCFFLLKRALAIHGLFLSPYKSQEFFVLILWKMPLIILHRLHGICRLLWVVHFGNIDYSNLRTQCIFPLYHLWFISSAFYIFWSIGLFVVFLPLPSHVWLYAVPWTAAHQAFLSLTISQSLPKFMYIASVMPSSHVILWSSPSALKFPNIRDFFQWVSCLHQVTKIQELKPQNQFFQWIFRVDFP